MSLYVCALATAEQGHNSFKGSRSHSISNTDTGQSHLWLSLPLLDNFRLEIVGGVKKGQGGLRSLLSALYNSLLYNTPFITL